tara:strand:- start:1089 stop:1337 length:249 start_codon:yes stop_codon:yes gene_type:complete
MIIVIAILSALIIVSLFVIWNLMKKNEILEDFVAKQSDAIDYSDKRLKTIDDKGSFIADDEVGWFFVQIKEIQEALNEFRLR